MERKVFTDEQMAIRITVILIWVISSVNHYCPEISCKMSMLFVVYMNLLQKSTNKQDWKCKICYADTVTEMN